MKNIITMCDDYSLELDNGLLIDCEVFYEMGTAKYLLPDYIIGESCKIIHMSGDDVTIRLFNGDLIEGTLM